MGDPCGVMTKFPIKRAGRPRRFLTAASRWTRRQAAHLPRLLVGGLLAIPLAIFFGNQKSGGLTPTEVPVAFLVVVILLCCA